MVLTIPAIGLTAPVLSADSEAAMSQGVGHLPTSSWPNQAGTDVLEAHDVTFFAHIDRLRRGDAVYLSAPCHAWQYRVTSGGVVHQGAAVVASRAPTLALVTCWPTNALYFTKQRYVVSAQLVGTSLSGPNLAHTPHFSVPGAALPPGLTPIDVSVNTMGVPEGTLKEAPTLAPALRSSAAALRTMAAATEIFDTGLLSAEKGNASWWASVSHGVPFSAAQPMSGGPPKWLSSVQISLGGSGASVTSATLAATVGVAGGQYQLVATLVAIGGHWEIGRWAMQRG